MTKASCVEACTTSEELHHRFRYDEDTGFLYWKNPASRRCKVGDRAGCEAHGYYLVWIKNALIYSHQVIWCMKTGKWPDDMLDHRDQNGLNNRFENLREVDNQKNSFNKGTQVNNKTGVPGVYLNTRGKYTAQITVNGKTKSLGAAFNSVEEAAAVRESKLFEVRKNFGLI